MDFHPYGELLASGSLDTAIKLWDIRRKGCIFTYKGHNRTVNSLKFSPDGQWIASAGEEGMVKVSQTFSQMYRKENVLLSRLILQLSLLIVLYCCTVFVLCMLFLYVCETRDIDLYVTFKLAVGPKGR